MAANKDFKQFFKELQERGWTIDKGRKSFKLRSPGGKLVTAALTPSCYFALDNVKAYVRRVEREERIENVV